MEVIVFGMENCAGCVTVKRMLNERGISYTERDVMNPEHMAEAQEHMVRGVPTTVISDESGFVRITGSTPKNINDILALVSQ